MHLDIIWLENDDFVRWNVLCLLRSKCISSISENPTEYEMKTLFWYMRSRGHTIELLLIPIDAGGCVASVRCFGNYDLLCQSTLFVTLFMYKYENILKLCWEFVRWMIGYTVGTSLFHSCPMEIFITRDSCRTCQNQSKVSMSTTCLDRTRVRIQPENEHLLIFCHITVMEAR